MGAAVSKARSGAGPEEDDDSHSKTKPKEEGTSGAAAAAESLEGGTAGSSGAAEGGAGKPAAGSTAASTASMAPAAGSTSDGDSAVWVPSNRRLGWLVKLEEVLPALRALSADPDGEVGAEAKRGIPGAMALGPDGRDSRAAPTEGGSGSAGAASGSKSVDPPKLPSASPRGRSTGGASAASGGSASSPAGASPSPDGVPADGKDSIDLSVEAPRDDHRPSAAVVQAADELDADPALLRRSTPRPDEEEAEDGALGSGLVSLEHLEDDPSEREEAVLGIAQGGGATTAVGPHSRPRALSASMGAMAASLDGDRESKGSAGSKVMDEDDSAVDELIAIAGPDSGGSAGEMDEDKGDGGAASGAGDSSSETSTKAADEASALQAADPASGGIGGDDSGGSGTQHKDEEEGGQT